MAQVNKAPNGASWMYDARHPVTKKRRQKRGFPTRRMAEEALRVLEDRWMREENGLIQKRSAFPVLASVLEEECRILRREARETSNMSDRRHKNHVASKAESYIELLPEGLRLDQLKEDHLRELSEMEIARGVKPITAQNYINYFRKALIRIKRRMRVELKSWTIPNYSVSRVEQPRDRLITESEIKRLLAALDNPPEDADRDAWRDAADFVRIAAVTGMRRSEILSLPWKGVVFPWELIKVKTLKQTKKEKYRDIPFTPILERVLRQRKRRAAPDARYVFPVWEVNQQAAKIVEAVGDAARLAELNYGRKTGGFVIHDFRHAATTNTLLRGIDIKTVSEIIGDKPETILRHYSHTTFDAKKRAVSIMDDYLGESGSEIEEDRKINYEKEAA